MNAVKPKNIDEYIAAFPEDTQSLLEKIRSIIKEIAPEAEEKISYGIPTFTLRGRTLIYFAAFKHHIGLYATPNGHEAFKEELSLYKQGRGSVQFPFNKPLPLDLIRRIVEFRTR